MSDSRNDMERCRTGSVNIRRKRLVKYHSEKHLLSSWSPIAENNVPLKEEMTIPISRKTEKTPTQEDRRSKFAFTKSASNDSFLFGKKGASSPQLFNSERSLFSGLTSNLSRMTAEMKQKQGGRHSFSSGKSPTKGWTSMRNLSLCEPDLSLFRGLGDEICKEDSKKLKDERYESGNEINNYVIRSWTSFRNLAIEDEDDQECSSKIGPGSLRKHLANSVSNRHLQKLNEVLKQNGSTWKDVIRSNMTECVSRLSEEKCNNSVQSKKSEESTYAVLAPFSEITLTLSSSGDGKVFVDSDEVSSRLSNENSNIIDDETGMTNKALKIKLKKEKERNDRIEHEIKILKEQVMALADKKEQLRRPTIGTEYSLMTSDDEDADDMSGGSKDPLNQSIFTAPVTSGEMIKCVASTEYDEDLWLDETKCSLVTNMGKLNNKNVDSSEVDEAHTAEEASLFSIDYEETVDDNDDDDSLLENNCPIRNHAERILFMAKLSESRRSVVSRRCSYS